VAKKKKKERKKEIPKASESFQGRIKVFPQITLQAIHFAIDLWNTAVDRTDKLPRLLGADTPVKCGSRSLRRKTKDEMAFVTPPWPHFP
jgi:hypothetical protein